MNDTGADMTPTKMGRPALFDPDRVVEQVADLFWAHGYDGVSLSDITAATGLSKSSLYNSFGGKDALFAKALTHYHDQTVQAGADWLALDDGTDPMEKLDQLLSGPADDVHGQSDLRGCFLCNTSADGIGRAPDVDRLIGKGFAQLEAGLMALFRRFSPDAATDTLHNAARLALTTYTGLRVRSRTQPTRAEFDSVRIATVQAVRAILKES
ncbi:TetR/AcrR family transcriptional regulator [Algimonas porphyrae]|uniref:TetR family transcriptional regulator n=1 Tax=Algimonas porphyrae TaxID=1128113 RepID=A0ABQ5V1N4_9PROT|nr:TetR/AcrR family transcriptional regulator [Algimonas porphyrae]GLQ20723.1 TetR family transcriptional regulator [Algimonas porphyrae]